MLRSVANSILARNYDESNISLSLIGSDWLRRFFKRHSKYIKRKLKPLIYNRKNIYDPINIRIYFEKFKTVYDFFGI
jgi:hypothetical protein